MVIFVPPDSGNDRTLPPKFYDAAHGGGIWVGKHYGAGGERIGDPVANHSHAVTVRQLLRFYWLLSRGELVSPAASRKMREIFLSPDIPHDDHKFVKGLSGRGLTILRKWGTWEDWRHDSAIVEGPGRRVQIAVIALGQAEIEQGMVRERTRLRGGGTEQPDCRRDVMILVRAIAVSESLPRNRRRRCRRRLLRERTDVHAERADNKRRNHHHPQSPPPNPHVSGLADARAVFN